MFDKKDLAIILACLASTKFKDLHNLMTLNSKINKKDIVKEEENFPHFDLYIRVLELYNKK